MHRLRNVTRALAVCAALSAAAIVGCGGGGGGSAPAAMLGSLTYSTKENIPVSGQLSATNTTGTVTYTHTSNPASGTLSTFTTAGAFSYKPNSGFSGSDSFTVQGTDSQGNVATGTVAITVQLDHPPTASSLIEREDGSALNSINVLSSASDPDGDSLTVTIAQAPPYGGATVNSDKTVSITGLPSGFKGVVPFQYKVTDPSGLSATGYAAIFVGTDPFRVAFAGDSSGNGSDEVYLANFAGAPQVISAATQGAARLQGFAAATGGATVVYRSEDPSNPSTTNSLFAVQTASPSTQFSISLPSGALPVPDVNGRDQFQVSPNGDWIAVVAGSGGTADVYVTNVTTSCSTSTKTCSVTKVAPSGILYETLPTFSPDSKSLYFLATSQAGGANRSLYYAALSNPAATALISAQSVVGTADDVQAYSISPDQTRILEQANRGGVVNLYYINPAQLQVEVQLNQPLATGESIIEDTVSLPYSVGSGNGDRVAYTVESSSTLSVYVANVSSSPQPTLVATGGARAIGFRPDDAALLYSKGASVYENLIGQGVADSDVGSGGNAWYDSTGNIVLLEQFLPSGGSPPSYPALAESVRGSFGSTTTVGNAAQAAQYFNVSGFGSGVVLLGEGPTTGTAAATLHLALVNALEPADLVYLASFDSPATLTSDIAEVVGAPTG